MRCEGWTWMRAVSFLGAALMGVVALASAVPVVAGAAAGGGVAGLGAGAPGGLSPPGGGGGTPGRVAMGGTVGLEPTDGGTPGAEGGRGADGIDGAEGGRGAGGGMSGRVAAGGGTLGAAPGLGSGVAAPSVVVSFFGASPGALIRTVSRFMGVSSWRGGSVMRTVSFFGEAEPGAGVAEGFSSAIKVRRILYLTSTRWCQTFAPDFRSGLAPGIDLAASGHQVRRVMNDETWAAADDYLAGKLRAGDAHLDACLEANAAADLPAIDVSPLQGKLLGLLAQIQGARRILEVGTLGGYSTIHLARALPADGVLITLELSEKHAAVARANIDRAGLGPKVQIIQGPAAQSLARLHSDAVPPFDFIFIDADKPGYPAYLPWALKLSRPGTVIIGDNVVRQGKVADANNADANVQGVRKFIDMVAAEPRLTATVVQTVGKKGYDGFLLARVSPA
jgi:predicted O-methyltransferase YrrM